MSIPPIKKPPTVASWFAIINILGQSQITLNNLAQAIGVIAALQAVAIANTAIAKGFQAAPQSLSLTNAGASKGIRTAAQQMAITDVATLRGVPGAAQSLSLADAAQVVGVVLSQQQINILSAGAVTGIEAVLTAGQVIPITNAATLRGIQAAGQNVTMVSTAAWYGKPGAAQVMAITETGAVKGIAAANVSLALTNSGAVYARLTAQTSFSLTNGASQYGKPDAAQSFSLSNSATVYEETETPLTIVGTANAISSAFGVSTVTLPAHQVGDAILVFSSANSGSVPGAPGAGGTVPTWTTLVSGASGLGVRVVGTIAIANNHTSGSWSNAASLAAIVLRGQDAVDAIGGTAIAGSLGGGTTTAPAITLDDSSGDSVILHFYASGNQSFSAAPAGYTRRANHGGGFSYGCVLNSKNTTTTDGSITQAGNNNGQWCAASIEILS